MKRMTSRERVLAALRHQEPDRVPLDCGAMRSTNLAAVAYNNLKRRLGVKGGETLVYDMVQQLAVPEQWFLDRFEVDVVDLGRAFCDDPSEWTDYTLPDGSKAKRPAWLPIERAGESWVFRDKDGTTLAEMPPKSYYFDQRFWPLLDAGESDLKQLSKYTDRQIWGAMASPPWHHKRRPDFYAELGRKAKALYDTTDYAIMAAYGAQLLEMGQFLRRMDNFLADLAGNRKFAVALLDALVELHIAGMEKFLKAVGPYVQIIQIGDDLGSQAGPQISPKMFHELFVPRYKRMYSEIKRLAPGIFIFMHTCGSITRLLPGIIEMGVDIVNPVQTSAAEMEPERLKREFGKDITFWGGGADTQYILPKGTPEQVRRDVEERVSVFAPGGGFIFAPVHNILADVPSDNVLAMYDAFKGVRDYPIRRKAMA